MLEAGVEAPVGLSDGEIELHRGGSVGAPEPVGSDVGVEEAETVQKFLLASQQTGAEFAPRSKHSNTRKCRLSPRC